MYRETPVIIASNYLFIIFEEFRSGTNDRRK